MRGLFPEGSFTGHDLAQLDRKLTHIHYACCLLDDGGWDASAQTPNSSAGQRSLHAKRGTVSLSWASGMAGPGSIRPFRVDNIRPFRVATVAYGAHSCCQSD